MPYNPTRALELLRIGTQNQTAFFREGQEDAIRHVVEGKGRLLVVQKTGWGKSFVYFIATKLLREQGGGPALLVSPLLALMRNQIAAAQRMGVRAVTINSENRDDWQDAESMLSQDVVDILLISPERLANEHFRAQVLPQMGARISLVVIDEAHCISDWGHDFRPHYRLIERIVRTLPQNVKLLGTTATANRRVLDDLKAVLGSDLTISRGELARPSLFLQTIRLPGQAERLAWLAETLTTLPGNGIIYTLTVRDAAQVAGWLKSRGHNVEAYTGDTGERRVELENSLLGNSVKALVATTALGMGFDKPDLAFVIHFQTPGSAVAYYQQVGRAGRALSSAYGVVLSGIEETRINDYFIESAFPSRKEVEEVLRALHSEPSGLSVPQLMARANVSYGRINKTLQLLSLETPSPIVKQDTKWVLTAANLAETFWERAERLTALRREEQKQMQAYVALEAGHMEFLVKALDGEPGAYQPPDLPPLPTTARPASVREAVAFLRRTSLPLEPRKQWPTGGLPQFAVKGYIAEEHRAEPGRVLCIWGDAGWGETVRLGKYTQGYFPDELVSACATLVQGWNPKPAPAWVTAVPSTRHPRLVPDFARRLAAALQIPFQQVLEKSDDRPEQKTMANGIKQALNIDGALAVAPGTTIPPGPVLLVDDMVDSRWTLTVAAWMLRSHGSGLVYPLALASTAHT